MNFLTKVIVFGSFVARSKEDVYNIYVDGRTAQPVPRKDIKGPAGEMFFRYHAASEKQGVRKVNATHAFVPFGKFLQADYQREMYPTNQRDSGLAKHMYGKNPVAIMGKDVVLGAVEKLSVQKISGDWATDAPQRMKKARDVMTPKMKAQAKRLHKRYTLTTAKYLIQSRLGSAIFEAAQDRKHLQAILDYTAEGDDAQAWAKSSRLSKKMDEAQPAFKDPIFRTDNNCHHFERTEGLELLKDGSGMLVPLGKMIAASRGQIGSGSAPHFSIMQGFSMFQFDEEADVMEVYYMGSSLLMNLNNQIIAQPGVSPVQLNATLYVGPADGENYHMAAGFGRVTPPEIDHDEVADLFKALAEMPYDFTQWERDPRKACGWWKFHSNRIALKHVHVDFYEDIINNDKKPNWKETLTLKTMVLLMSSAFDCGLTFLRGPQGLEINRINALNAMIIWGHGMLELAPENRIPYLGHKDWDVLEDYTRFRE